MPQPRHPRVLVARGVDGLLVGWLAVIVWIAVYLAGALHVDATFPGLQIVYWVGLVATAAHFGLSYHLGYRGGTKAMRAKPLPLVWAPAGLAAILVGVVVASLAAGTQATRDVTSWLIASVYLMTTWHYVKQVYGVGRVGAAFAGAKITVREGQILRYGLYPLWFVGAAQVLSGGAGYSLAGYRFGLTVLPHAAVHVLDVLALCAAAPVFAVIARVALRARRLPPSLLVAPYVAAFLWLGLPTNPVLLILLLAPFHALQYLAVAHRAELAVAEPDARIGWVWWLNIFGGAAAGGLLLSRWAPQFLDAHLNPGGGPLVITAAFFVFLNLHHYLIDASIWRSNGELVKAMGKKRPSLDAVPAAAPAPVAAAAVQGMT